LKLKEIKYLLSLILTFAKEPVFFGLKSSRNASLGQEQ